MNPGSREHLAFQYLLVELQGVRTTIFSLVAASVGLLGILAVGLYNIPPSLLPEGPGPRAYIPHTIVIGAASGLLYCQWLYRYRCGPYLREVKSAVKGQAYGSIDLYLDLEEILIAHVFRNEVRRQTPEAAVKALRKSAAKLPIEEKAALEKYTLEVQEVKRRIQEANRYLRGESMGPMDLSWAVRVLSQVEAELLPEERRDLWVIRSYFEGASCG